MAAGSEAPRVAVYCRLSEEDRDKARQSDDSASIQNQKAMLLQYAEERGWQLVGVYSDDDYAGADRSRPAFNRLLEDARQGQFDIVLCKTQSRFTRELELVEKYLHGLFPLWGVRFVSVVDNADTANKGNKKSRQINGLVNEWYLEDLSDNIRGVLDARRREGYHIGAFAPYGYRKDPDHKGRLLVDQEAAAVVWEIFTLFSQGWGKAAIARHLNSRGVPAPTAYKRLQGLRYRQPPGKAAALWKYPAVARVLSNEMYLGNMVQGRYGSVSYKTKQNRPRPRSQWIVVEGTHQPLVSRPLWDRVQALLSQRSKPFAGGELGLFARKARCAHCGYTLRSSKSSPQRGGRRYLQCPTRRADKSACPGAFLSEERLEQAVLGELNRLAASLLDRERLARGIRPPGGLEEARDRLAGELSTLRKQLSQEGAALRQLYLDRAQGLLSQGEYRELSQGFARERERLEQALAQGEGRLAQMEERLRPREGTEALARRYAQLDRLPREAVELFIDYIAVGSRIPGTRHVPIAIHWNL